MLFSFSVAMEFAEVSTRDSLSHCQPHTIELGCAVYLFYFTITFLFSAFVATINARFASEVQPNTFCVAHHNCLKCLMI